MKKPNFNKITALGMVMLIVFVASAKPAHADPHAVFYTTIGQQQLFFNMLAALDQADYVEPASPDLGISSGQSRQELLGKRQTAGFGPAVDDRLKATTTQLSSVVTRAVTLEGYDLWSAYLLYQFSLEAARRSGIDEITRVYCQLGLGLTKCLEKENADGETPSEQQKKAFIVDPQERSADARYLGITGILNSNYDPGSGYQTLSDNLDKTNRTDDAYAALRDDPLPFDTALATLRQRADSQEKLASIDSATETARRALNGGSVDETTFDDVSVDINGDVSLNTDDSETSTSFINRYVDKVFGFLDLPSAAISTGSRGLAIADQYLNATENDGAVADVKAPRIPLKENPVISQGRGTQISVPAHVKVAEADAVINSIPSTEESLTSVPAQGEHIPGDTQLVDRTNGNTDGGAVKGSSSVLGATTDISGQVAGISDNLENSSEYHDPKTPYSPNTNPIHFQHEEAPDDLLRVIGYNVAKYGCGCTARNFLSQYGSQILGKI